jgi:hypothetical protein
MLATVVENIDEKMLLTLPKNVEKMLAPLLKNVDEKNICNTSNKC